MTDRSRGNIRKRGQTYTYYVYVMQPDGWRQQVSKGGFRTRREAEAARIQAMNAVQTGMFVRPERITLARFLLDEWLPTRRPPNLEESTYASYERDIRLHVIPYIGSIRLQELTPTDLNGCTEDCSRRGAVLRGHRAVDAGPSWWRVLPSSEPTDRRTERSPNGSRGNSRTKQAASPGTRSRRRCDVRPSRRSPVRRRPRASSRERCGTSTRFCTPR